MNRYEVTITIVEARRVVQVDARSKGEALAKARLGEWDAEHGATDPERYHVSTHGPVRELSARERALRRRRP